ncbi:MAG: type 4a pilus biogenesis protein PilO [Candidatus Omnitrophota bacterium]
MGPRFSEREKKIFVLATGILILFGAIKVFEALTGRWQDLQQKIQAAEKEVSVKMLVLGEKRQRVSTQRAVLDSFRQNDPDEMIRSNMLSSLQKLSSENNVRITDMKPSVIKSDKFYKEFPVNVILEGSFTDIMRFFYYAESAEFQFEIREFRFSQSYGMPGGLRCQAILSRLFLPLAGET